MIAAGAALLYGCGKSADAPKTDAAAAAAVSAPSSGINPATMDTAVRAEDDTYRHMNGKWLDSFEIPADKARYGSFTKLADDAERQLRELIEASAANAEAKPNTEPQQIGDLYKSFMDEAGVEAAGLKAIDSSLTTIDAMPDKSGIPGLMAGLSTTGVGSPFVPFVHQDNKDSTKYVVDLYQYSLGLPVRD